MTIFSRSTLLSIVAAGFLAGCASPVYTPKPFTPASLNPSAYVPKVDAFVVVVDASSSMNSSSAGRPMFFTAKDVVNSLNQTIPELGYESALVGFGSGSCLHGESARVVYGPAIYRREDFAKGLSMLECAGGVTPMSDGLSLAAGLPKAGADEIALILVSDFLQIDARAVNAAVDKLRAGYDNRLCIHTIRVGKFTESNDLIAALARVDGCGSSVEADALASPAAVSKYVTDVLLKPAPAAAAIKYEKNTVAASALFAHDKAVLTSQGKAALHKLDESIRAKGATVVDIQVVGHTDNAGTEKHNMGLSIRRAEAVRDYMVSEGVAPSIIRVSGEGETKPVASNATREGRAQNRRVDIIVGIKQPG